MWTSPRESRNPRGASAVEYALLLAGIAAVVVIAVLALGGPVDEMFTDTCDEFDAQTTVSADCS
ncbi:MAG: Flp family type IVb pilin [Nocardioides sp.]